MENSQLDVNLMEVNFTSFFEKTIGVLGNSTEPYSRIKRSIGIQTTYRESSIQTNPYTPEFVVKGVGVPDVLKIAEWRYGNELPPTKKEIEEYKNTLGEAESISLPKGGQVGEFQEKTENAIYSESLLGEEEIKTDVRRKLRQEDEYRDALLRCRLEQRAAVREALLEKERRKNEHRRVKYARQRVNEKETLLNKLFQETSMDRRSHLR